MSIIEFLKQPSTVKGVITLGSLLGFALTPDQYANFMLIPPVFIGLWETGRHEFKKRK